jgi:hypothetical protein
MIPKSFQRKMAEANGIEFLNEINVPSVDLNKEFLYKFIDMPNIEEIGQRVWKHMPVDLKTTQYRTIDASHYEKIKILVDSVETIHPWKDILGIGLIIATPNSIVPIHTDHNVPHMYALNVPIYNTSKPTTWFFKSKEGCNPWYASQGHGDPFNFYFLDDVDMIDAYSLVKPAIFNTHVPHAIINNTDDFRCVLSFRFNSPFDFEKIKNKFINIDMDIDRASIEKDIIRIVTSSFKF